MNWFKKKPIYMDYAAATPVLPAVRQVMEKYWQKDFYNPSAIYEEGNKVRREIDEHRTNIAKLVGAAKTGITFTSGGTESNNLAILGTVESFKEVTNKKPHIIISSIEHAAIQAAADEVERLGGEVSVVPVGEFGRVSPENVMRAVKHNTAVVSIMFANNEVGTVQNISKIGRLIREHRKSRENIYPYIHTDASQAPSYLDVSIERLQCDLMTLDAGKIYGPKGVGALIVRGGIKLRPLIIGGEQERGMRSGTENPALIAGFAAALYYADKDREVETARLSLLQKYFVDNLETIAPEAVINTPIGESLPNILSISVPNELGEMMLLKLEKEGVLVSLGSACSRDQMESGSPVIRAMGKPDLAESTLRFSFGRGTTRSDVERALRAFSRILGRDNMSA